MTGWISFDQAATLVVREADITAKRLGHSLVGWIVVGREWW